MGKIPQEPITQHETTYDIPSEIMEVFTEFRLCEFTTLSKKGTPVTWPVDPFLKPPETEYFLFLTPIGFPVKAFNIRRNPRVSILFSEPMGSALTDPPYVLVQGDGEVSDKIHTSFPGTEEQIVNLLSRSPSAAMMGSSISVVLNSLRLQQRM